MQTFAATPAEAPSSASTATEQDLARQAILQLARQAIERIKSTAQSQLELSKLIEQKLAEASHLVEQGQTLPARKLLHDVVTLYDGKVDVAPLVDQARQRLKELDAAGAK